MRFWIIALLAIGFATAFILLFAGWFIFTFPSRELKKEMDWLKANKLPTKIGELLPPVPDSQNAAPLYGKAFAVMNLSEDEASWLVEQMSRKRILSGQVDWVKLKQLVERNREALRLVHQAVSLPHLRLTNWQKENPLDIEFPHFSKMRNLARLLSADTMLKRREGDMESAIRNSVTVFRMTKHSLEDVPVMMGLLIGLSIFSVGYNTLEVMLADADVKPKSYRSLLEALSYFDFPESAIRAWRGERTFGLAIYNWFREAQPEKVFDRLREITGRQEPNEQLQRLSDLSSKANWSLIQTSDQALYLWAMREGEEKMKAWLLQSPMPLQSDVKRQSDQFEEEFMRRAKRRLALISSVLTPSASLWIFASDAAKKEAQRRIAMASIAIRLCRHENGRYPESLLELVPKYSPSVPIDLFSKKPIQYRRTQKGFIVWSIGWDGKDDGGSFRLDEHEGEKGDIVWEGLR